MRAYRDSFRFCDVSVVNLASAVQVNLPSSLKMTRPRIQLAGEGTGSPLPLAKPSKGTEVIVVAGEVGKGKRISCIC